MSLKLARAVNPSNNARDTLVMRGSLGGDQDNAAPVGETIAAAFAARPDQETDERRAVG